MDYCFKVQESVLVLCNSKFFLVSFQWKHANNNRRMGDSWQPRLCSAWNLRVRAPRARHSYRAFYNNKVVSAAADRGRMDTGTPDRGQS